MSKHTFIARVTLRNTLKGVVQQILREDLGPRDLDGMWATLALRGADETHSSFMHRVEWALGPLLSYLQWQTRYLNGDLDLDAFEQEWALVRPIIAALVDVTQLHAMCSVSDTPPDVRTRASALEF